MIKVDREVKLGIFGRLASAVTFHHCLSIHDNTLPLLHLIFVLLCDNKFVFTHVFPHSHKAKQWTHVSIGTCRQSGTHLKVAPPALGFEGNQYVCYICPFKAAGGADGRTSKCKITHNVSR